MRSKPIIASVLMFGIVAGFIGTQASATHEGFVNFGNGYANTHTSSGDMIVDIKGETAYDPAVIQFVVDDNGGSVFADVSWAAKCYTSSGTQLNVSLTGPTNVELPFTGFWEVPAASSRCTLRAKAVSGNIGHIDVTLRAAYDH